MSEDWVGAAVTAWARAAGVPAGTMTDPRAGGVRTIGSLYVEFDAARSVVKVRGLVMRDASVVRDDASTRAKLAWYVSAHPETVAGGFLSVEENVPTPGSRATLFLRRDFPRTDPIAFAEAAEAIAARSVDWRRGLLMEAIRTAPDP